ncbi:unnamed protein product [Clonostachys rosea f. rosea IK726]|uniref:ditrans,polycis-polyprenyl diphosphate synthase [(2E,6E)-farnesyldiphosphate specific] n=2 Tax=Bionectria ochroleuca TaxID=29856 RepID=A0A0B7JSN1_BIOOC|nr:unnamed protein product [Clonostachys rosea f. rosea IK726]
MPMSTTFKKAYRADASKDHTLLTPQQRRYLFEANLPAMNEPSRPRTNSTTQRKSRLGVRKFIKTQLYVLIFALMHGIFSLYIRTRQAWNIVGYQMSSVLFYHHATPQYIQKDVTGLSKLPNHLSAILRSENPRLSADLDRLIDETAELATWCACAGIPMLSVYEKTGVLKKHMPRLYQAVIQKLAFYYGGEHPSLSLTCPHQESYSSPNVNTKESIGHLRLHLISSQDGRDSMVDLTRTLADMSQRGKLSPQDISMDLINAELSEGVMAEPDLLILFSPHIELSSYPPWQIRLTEIFCLQDNESFSYQVFIKALRNFASAQMRRGK